VNRTRWLSLLLVLVSARLPAAEFPVEVIESFDNSRVVAFFNETDIDAAPAWTPSTAPPPLEVGAALQAVRNAGAGDPRLAGAELAKIELRRIPRHEQHWHYVVKLETHGAEHTVAHYFFVLMDGRVIRGLREPQAVK
jgi:hypothetical protein